MIRIFAPEYSTLIDNDCIVQMQQEYITVLNHFVNKIGALDPKGFKRRFFNFALKTGNYDEVHDGIDESILDKFKGNLIDNPEKTTLEDI